MKTLIVARCGDTQNAPESTLASFELAIDKGADAIEFDVHLTADNELIVHHDYYLGRTAQGNGFIGEHSLEQLTHLDIGSWFKPNFSEERMPTLDQIFELGKRRVRFEIDLRTPSETFIQKVLGRVSFWGIADDIEITSTHNPLLFEVKQINPRIRTGVFFQPLPDWMEEKLGLEHILGWMEMMKAEVAHLPCSLISEKFVEQVQNKGFLVHGANLNTEEEIRRGINLGIDQFSTDTLDKALSISKEFV